MHRIAGYGKYEIATGLYGFYNGDAANSIPRTIIEDDWLNALQEEIAECIEVQGTTLGTAAETVANMTQLNDAIGQSWASWEYLGAGTITELEGRNASVAYTGDGIYTITWDNDFADVNYCVLATAGYTDSTATALIAFVTDIAVGSCVVRVKNDSGAYAHVSNMRVNVRATGTMA